MLVGLQFTVYLLFLHLLLLCSYVYEFVYFIKYKSIFFILINKPLCVLEVDLKLRSLISVYKEDLLQFY